LTALDILISQLILVSKQINRLTFAFLIQHDHNFSSKVNSVLMPLLVAVDFNMIETVKLYHFATEEII